MPGIEAVVFDADGTLMDTFPVIHQNYVDVADEFGFTTPTAEIVRPLIGLKLSDCYEALVDPSEYDIIELTRKHKERSVENYNEMASEISVYDGIPDELEKLRAAGLPLAVFSSRGPSLRFSLETTGLIEYFGKIVDGDDREIKDGKPAPDGILIAHERMGVDFRRGSYVGDAPVDILAGKNAGVLATIGASWGYSKPRELRAAMPDRLIHQPGALAYTVLNFRG